MEWTELRSELHRLTAIVEGWNAPEEITGIERDLALAKLRSIYDLLRFGDPSPKSLPPIAGEASDIAAVLALEPFSIEQADTFALLEESSDEESRADALPAGAGSRPAAEPIVAERISDGRTPAGAESDSSGGESAADAAIEPERASAPTAGFAAAVGTAPLAGAAESEQGEADAAPQAGNGAEEPAASAVGSATADPAPTLFGLEEDPSRHRRRQRVIMSLYDADPAVSARREPTDAQAAGAAVVAVSAEFSSGEPVSALERLAAVQGAPVPQSASAGEHAGRDSYSRAEAAASAPEAAADAAAAGKDFAACGAVLGEVINHDVRTLGETIAPQRGEASELARTEPVTDLRRAIGINDKFLLLRDLFGGDEAAYGGAIDALNGMESLDDCMIWIAERHAWNADCDGAKLLMELLERKYA